MQHLICALCSFDFSLFLLGQMDSAAASPSISSYVAGAAGAASNAPCFGCFLHCSCMREMYPLVFESAFKSGLKACTHCELKTVCNHHCTGTVANIGSVHLEAQQEKTNNLKRSESRTADRQCAPIVAPVHADTPPGIGPVMTVIANGNGTGYLFYQSVCCIVSHTSGMIDCNCGD
jgi:hypothetical protein